jgi:O-methyltransferase involved in polyketide biosynthesis
VSAGLIPFDSGTPNVARIYDYWLGGKDNFAADREVAEQICALYPEMPVYIRRNRQFILAAVRRAASAGITQFIDLGSGLPARPSVHEAAREIDADARVAYVDHDPVVVTHAAALLAKGAGLAVTRQDLTDPATVLADPEVRAVHDAAAPCAIILGYIVHFMAPDQARALIASWRDAMPAASWIIVSAGRNESPERMAEFARAYKAAELFNHTPQVFASFFDGLDLVRPGVTEADRWVRGIEEPTPVTEGWVMCGAGIKP